jgi:DNA-binding NarL/FixJ family response regulator
MRVLVIDDQPLIVSGLRAVMGSFHAPVAVSCAESAEVARQVLASDLHFDLVLLDLELEESGGFDFLCELRTTHPAISIVVLSTSNSNELVSRAIFMGAMGFVFKRASNAMLIEALHLVISGVVYVPPMKLRSQSAPESRATVRDNGWGAGVESLPVGNLSATRSFASARGLTSRQTQVLELLLLGQSNKLIARALHLSVDTVKDHVTSLLRILNVTSRTQAVLAVGQLSDRARHPTDTMPFRSVAKHLIDDGRSLATFPD